MSLGNPPRKAGVLWEGHPGNDAVMVMRKGEAATLEEGVRLSSTLAGGDGDVPVQAVDDGEAELAPLQ